KRATLVHPPGIVRIGMYSAFRGPCDSRRAVPFSSSQERTMRLPQFIVANVEPILAEFEEFARTHTTAGETMDIRSLRDHADGMLRAIALDMEEPQTEREQKRKSKGEAPPEEEA